MLYLISPAKTLDFDTPVDPELDQRATRPAFVAESAELIGLLRQPSVDQLRALMALSEPLAALNAARYAAWRERFTRHNSRPALLAFAGEVYLGLQARSLSMPQWGWAQDHLAILSGLHGVLRPLDRLQPYRLEMGTRLANRHGADLYRFWGRRLAAELDRRCRGHRHKVLVNLASQEYARAVDRTALRARVVDCVFQESDADGHHVIGVFAKRARGLMARHLIEQAADDPQAIDGFAAAGYRFDPQASDADRRVFRRPRQESLDG